MGEGGRGLTEGRGMSAAARCDGFLRVGKLTECDEVVDRGRERVAGRRTWQGRLANGNP